MNGFGRVFGVMAGFVFLYPVHGYEALHGRFMARQTCSATLSLHTQDGDGIRVEAGESYTVLGLNKPGGGFVQIRIPGSKPNAYWVSRGCGTLSGADDNETDGAGRKFVARSLLLALSWQPAFCERHPDKPECQLPEGQSLTATGFSLHGLWLDPEGFQYCEVSDQWRRIDEARRWDALPEPSLDATTRIRLAGAMPGLVSNLHRHEWIRHGLCFGLDAGRYFTTAMNLQEQVNRSVIPSVMASRQGKDVSVAALRAAFEQSFGVGSGRSLGVYCSQTAARTLIGEIRIRLRYPVDETTRLQDALDPSLIEVGNCDRGIVDRAGQD